MAHFAQIDENNRVVQVIVVDTRDTSTADGVEKESIGEAFCERLFGGVWKKTSYNTQSGVHTSGGVPLRGNYAGIGYTYDATNDVFYGPQPYPSWTISAPNWQWTAPTPMPADSNLYLYSWNEETKAWDKTNTLHGSTSS
jgi:hypothetical protein